MIFPSIQSIGGQSYSNVNLLDSQRKMDLIHLFFGLFYLFPGAQVLLVGFPVAMILVEHVGCTCLHLRLQNPEPQMLSLDGLATFTISFQLMVQPRYPRGPLRKPLSFRLEIQRFHEISGGLHQSGPQKQTKGTTSSRGFIEDHHIPPCYPRCYSRDGRISPLYLRYSCFVKPLLETVCFCYQAGPDKLNPMGS